MEIMSHFAKQNVRGRVKIRDKKWLQGVVKLQIHIKKTYTKVLAIAELGIFFDKKSLQTLDILKKMIYIAIYLL